MKLVKHQEGTCALSAQKRWPSEGRISVKTLCQHYVILPWGYSEGAPTCDECRNAIDKEPKE